MTSFSERIKQLLEENEISAKKLGTILKINHTSMYDYLAGKYPSIENAVKLANYFNCSLNFLFGLDDYADETSWTQNYDATLFLERYTNLLKQNGISHYKVCKETKLNESSIRLWKKGKLPKIVSLVEIAKCLNCSIDYLVGRSEKIR